MARGVLSAAAMKTPLSIGFLAVAVLFFSSSCGGDDSSNNDSASSGNANTADGGAGGIGGIGGIGGRGGTGGTGGASGSEYSAYCTNDSECGAAGTRCAQATETSGVCLKPGLDDCPVGTLGLGEGAQAYCARTCTASKNDCPAKTRCIRGSEINTSADICLPEEVVGNGSGGGGGNGGGNTARYGAACTNQSQCAGSGGTCVRVSETTGMCLLKTETDTCSDTTFWGGEDAPVCWPLCRVDQPNCATGTTCYAFKDGEDSGICFLTID